MTLSDKELLIRDLCARLPYGVIVQSVGENKILGLADLFNPDLFLPKPYLHPMSSMTEEEIKEFCHLQDMVIYNGLVPVTEDVNAYVDWLLSHHFDFRGLIDKGLAIEAPEGMYKE